MPKKETFKDVEVGGRKWRIGKFDALTGSYILYQVMSGVLPMGIETQMTGMGLPKGRGMMSKEDFISLQKECLGVCYELVTVGANNNPVPVILSNGAWGVEGINDDLNIVIALTVHSLLFNLISFFDESALKELTESFRDLPQFNASM